MDLLALLAIATAPGVAIGVYIYLKDKHEREPIALLVRAFMFGAVGVVITLLVSIPINSVISINEQNLSEQAVHAFLIVALVEEFSKFIFVRGILYRNANFNEPFDGIVYSVMVGMGFATLENIMLVVQGGFSVGILRMFTAVPAHAGFAVLMGYFLGKAKFEHRKGYYSLYALGVATVFHGAYDYCLFVSYLPGIFFGALASLTVAIILSRRAIHLHQLASPFKYPGIVGTVPIDEAQQLDKPTQNV
jgi:RsiW-degrading membrane proteinase PrsW (M82 family)